MAAMILENAAPRLRFFPRSAAEIGIEGPVAAYFDDLAQSPRVYELPYFEKGRVESLHESKHQYSIGPLRRFDNAPALGHGSGHGFLAENVQTAIEGIDALLAVRPNGRGDDDRVHSYVVQGRDTVDHLSLANEVAHGSGVFRVWVI